MKTKLLFSIGCLIITCLSLSAVKLHSISSVVFYNFSNQNYDVAGHHITVNETIYNVDDLGMSNTVVAPGTTITFDINVPSTPASIVLWSAGAFPSTDPQFFSIIDFMQYGAANNPYEDKAVQAGRWIAGDFVAGSPPFQSKTNNYGDVGAGFWEQSGGGVGIFSTINNNVTIGPNPVFENSPINIFNLPVGKSTISISVIDAKGAIIQKLSGIKEQNIQLETANWAKGIYHITAIRDMEVVLSRKFIKP
jgi:hypothetical protein